MSEPVGRGVNSKMDGEARQFLEDLLVTPSPSGYEQPVQDLVRRFADALPPKSSPMCTAT